MIEQRGIFACLHLKIKSYRKIWVCNDKIYAGDIPILLNLFILVLLDAGLYWGKDTCCLSVMKGMAGSLSIPHT